MGGGTAQFGLTMAHEFAHFIDNYIGENINKTNKYACEKEGSTASKITKEFKKEFNKQGADSAYWKRSCECFARSMEQYFAEKKGMGNSLNNVSGYKMLMFISSLLNMNISKK